MSELFSEVRFDFSSAKQLADYFRQAQGFTGRIRSDLAGVGNQFRNAFNGVNQQGQQSKASEHLAAAGVAAAAGGAFFYRAGQLASPASMQRFQDALDDTVAVIGHQLIPALEWLTRQIRAIGDWFARHPTAASAAGYGATALALGAAGYATYRVGSMAFRGGLGAVGAAGSAYRYFGGGANAATAAGEAGGMGFSAAGGSAGPGAAAGSFGPRVQMRWDAARGAYVPATEAGIEGGTSAVANARRIQVGGEAGGAEAAGFFGRFGRTLLGRSLGRVAPWIDPALTVYEGANAENMNEFLQSQRRYRTIADAGSPAAPLLNIYGAIADLFPQSFDEAGRRTGAMLGNKPGPEVSSWGAAARPASYQDILGSVMSMRQEIAQGGVDPDSMEEYARRTADNTSIIANVLSLGGIVGDGTGEQRGTTGGGR